MCEEYRLHRETYYLAIDLFDRFMDMRTNVKKEQLQLLGVSCLFIAAKIEVCGLDYILWVYDLLLFLYL